MDVLPVDKKDTLWDIPSFESSLTTDEQLIDVVKQFPCLWNVTLDTYKCIDIKEEAWKEVVKRTQLPNVRIAKGRWKQLRDNHRDALKRMSATRSGQLRRQKKMWKHQLKMEFLLPFITFRDKQSNDNDSEAPQYDHQEFIFLHEPNTTNAEIKQEIDSTPNTDNVSIQPNQEQEDRLQENRFEVSIDPSGDDEIEHFYLTMAKTVRKLPPHLQIQVKRACFNALLEAEEKNLENRSTS